MPDTYGDKHEEAMICKELDVPVAGVSDTAGKEHLLPNAEVTEAPSVCGWIALMRCDDIAPVPLAQLEKPDALQ